MNVIYALWINTKPISENCAPDIVTVADVRQGFTGTSVYIVAGRPIRIDFETFPELNVTRYDKDNGDGAAKRALEEYNQVPSSERFDTNDVSTFVLKMKIAAPPGMSYVNVVYAMWINSKPAMYFNNLLQSPPDIETVDHVKNSFRGTYVDYIAGRLIRTDFLTFPELDVSEYDKSYGDGAAALALEKYNAVPSLKRFDSNDACTFALKR